MNFKDASFKGLDITGVDFSGAKNLTWKSFEGVKSISGVRFPKGMDLSGVSFGDTKIVGAEFAGVKNLTMKQILDTGVTLFYISSVPNYLKKEFRKERDKWFENEEEQNESIIVK